MCMDRHLTGFLIFPDHKFAHTDHVTVAIYRFFFRDKVNMGMKNKLFSFVTLCDIKDGLLVSAFYDQ